MYSEFHQFSFLNMSNSDFFLDKSDQKTAEFNIFSPPMLQSPSDDISSNIDHHHQLENHQQVEDVKKEEIFEASVSSSKELRTHPSIGQQSEVADDDNNGFRTPTSLDSKIPVAIQCPPAPKKNRRHQSSKRKLSPRLHQTLQLDLSKEVESMFPPRLQEDLGQKIKKSRKDDAQ